MRPPNPARRSRRRVPLLVVLAVAALVPLAACDVGTKAPAPQAQPPCRGSSGVGGPVPAGLGPGDLVSSEELTAANQESPGFPTGARVWRVLYVSTSADETDLQLVCGTVALPESGPRTIGSGSGDGGRLLAWSHGTIGLEQRCLPSSDPATHFWGPMPGGIQAVAWGSLLGKHQGRPEDGALQYAMDNGWAVVATDYQPDDTYILGRVAAANVLDSARAATQLGQEVFGPDTPDRYDMITWGHSQGGHAALWAGQLAETYLEGTEPSRPTPTIELAGVAALAPAGNFVAEPGDQPGVAYGDGLADWEMHEGIPELLNLPIPALELQIGPALFSFIFGSWNQFAQGNRPSPDAEFPASPPNTPEPVLEDIATPTGIETINTVMPQCLAGADAKVIGEATSQYRNAGGAPDAGPRAVEPPRRLLGGRVLQGWRRPHLRHQRRRRPAGVVRLDPLQPARPAGRQPLPQGPRGRRQAGPAPHGAGHRRRGHPLRDAGRHRPDGRASPVGLHVPGHVRLVPVGGLLPRR